MFHEPSIPVSPGISDLPLEAIFGKDSLGYVNIRSGWADKDIFFRFNCGDYFTGHQHLDQGNFTIFKHEPLVIDAGYYAAWSSGHRENYYCRTIAHNTMLVHQPEERFQTPYEVEMLNDGGQRVVWYYRRSAQQQIFTLEDYLSRKNSGAHYETGDIRDFEAKDSYVYINADITNAYNNPEFSAESNKPKIKEFARQIITLKPEYYFIIFDKVSSLNPEYPKVWLLHCINEPTVLAGELDNAGLGYTTYNSGIVRIDNGRGRLFCKTIYPDKHNITIIGGQGYDFWVNGYNQDDGVPIKLEKYAEPGTWRIEVQPAVAREDDIFLHVLYPCDSEAEAMPESESIEVKDGTGLRVADRVVVFSKSEDGLTYEVRSSQALRHLVCNLKPEIEYVVEIKGTEQEASQQSVVASSAGVVEFEAQGDSVKIVIASGAKQSL